MRRLIFLTAFAALSGCGGATLYYAEGVTLAARDADLAQCSEAAGLAYPVALQTRREPPRFIPPRQVCDAAGTCVTYPGGFEAGEVFTTDVNAGLRRAATQSCMARQGYSEIGLPFCANGVVADASTRMPPLTQDSCLLRGYGAAPLVVNPGG